MLYLRKYFLKNTRRDLISKFNHYENINKINSIKSIDFNFSDLKNKKFCLLALGFLFLITNKKGFIPSLSRKNFSKNFRCRLKLNNKESLKFLEIFVRLNLKNILDLDEGFSSSSFSDKGTFSFMVKDLYVFSELGDSIFKFRNLKNLNIFITFDSFNNKENLELLRSFGISFF